MYTVNWFSQYGMSSQMSILLSQVNVCLLSRWKSNICSLPPPPPHCMCGDIWLCKVFIWTCPLSLILSSVFRGSVNPHHLHFIWEFVTGHNKNFSTAWSKGDTLDLLNINNAHFIFFMTLINNIYFCYSLQMLRGIVMDVLIIIIMLMYK